MAERKASKSGVSSADNTLKQVDLPAKDTRPARNVSPSRLPVGPSRPSSMRQAPATREKAPVAHRRFNSLNKEAPRKTPAAGGGEPSTSAARTGTQPAARTLTKKPSATALRKNPVRAASNTQVKRAPDPRAPHRNFSQESTEIKERPKSSGKLAPQEPASKPEKPALKGTSPRKRATPTTQAETAPKAVLNSRESLEECAELLHLHVIHSTSVKTQEELKQSAYDNYRKQFQSLANLDASLNEKEKDVLEQENAMAFLSWGSQSGSTLERRVQALSKIVRDVWDLTGNHGKYGIALQAFEHWYDNAQVVQRRRMRDSSAGVVPSDLMEGLGDGWKAEVASLQVKLLQDANDLLSLGAVEAESDLARCVTIVSEMLKNMLEELEMMQFIENSMVQQEQFWLQVSLDKIADDIRHL